MHDLAQFGGIALCGLLQEFIARLLDLRAARLQDLDQKVDAGAEVIIDRRQVDARLGRDVPDRHGFQPLFTAQALSRLENRLSRIRRIHAAACTPLPPGALRETSFRSALCVSLHEDTTVPRPATRPMLA